MSAAHRFEVRVYYEDTDFSGNVYHAAYLHFFERARTEFLRAEGIHHSELAKEGIAFAVRRWRSISPAPRTSTICSTVETTVVDLSGARLTLEQTISRDGDGADPGEGRWSLRSRPAGGAARMPKTDPRAASADAIDAVIAPRNWFLNHSLTIKMAEAMRPSGEARKSGHFS